MNLKRKFASLGASLALALSLLGVVAQPVLGLTCPGGIESVTVGSGTLRAVFYESRNYNVGAPASDNSSLCWYTGNSTYGIADLHNIPYSSIEDGSCAGQFYPSFYTWNDCFSSFKFVSDCHHNITLWQDAGYSGASQNSTTSWNNPNMDASGHFDNNVSSAKIGYSSACVSAPGP